MKLKQFQVILLILETATLLTISLLPHSEMSPTFEKLVVYFMGGANVWFFWQFSDMWKRKK